MAPVRPHGGPRHHADFIKRFTEQEAQRRDARRKVPLTATQRAARREKLRQIRFLKPADADCTQINISGMLRKWKRYCDSAELGPWLKAIRKADRATAMDFLDHLCENYKITSWGTSWEYFRQYKQLYARKAGRYMDLNDSKEVQKWHDAVLIPKYDLQAPKLLDKQVGDWNDLLVLQTFNIAYDTRCYLFLACTGCRPAEIVDNEKKKPKDGSWEELYGPKAIHPHDRNKTMRHELAQFDSEYVAAQVGACEDDAEDELSDEDARLIEEMLSAETSGRGRPKALCYEDILLMVVRHPVTGEDVLAMAVKFIHHKGADNKPKPTIFFFTLTRRLMFCLITVIISIAIDDKAFDAPSLTSVRRVFGVKNTGPVTCTPLRWKKEWLKRPVFRRFNGPDLSEDEALQYPKLRDDMGRQSLDAGEEKPMQPKDWRRGAANEANGKAPDAVRDQMMRHDPKWATFNSAYINAKVKFHLQNAVLHEPHEDALIEMLTHISVTRDPRAGRDIVPDEVWREMPPDPEIVELERRREMLKGGQYRIQGRDNEQEIRDLTKEINNKKAQREYRADYFYNRPTWDIERQARGEEEEEEEEYDEPAIDLLIPERAQLAEILCKQPEGLSHEDLIRLRIQAAELWVALCGKRETARCRRIRRRARPEVSVKEETPASDPFPLLMQKTQCPRCIGDEMLPYEIRTFPFCRPAVMNDHFDREHLGGMKENERRNLIFCDHPKCKEEGMKLKNLDHFRAHVMSVHGVELRRSDRVKSFPKPSRRVVPVFS
ncbi:hypothetical protein QBC46DRAFT_453549 [Diplogelasinospora grovesii]|uniref:FluG domain-containing protein n=1 Tax=Diplogelasinospora grovesii TaxID=303347 RepID=A0AAN6S0C3_9PEZI|nr:hypothetical protein QBC46DRAFT_453549 [Diplogelasinospora grovesii]